ncbi:MAG: histidine kinase dimerization/phospho-acceptor domain-containing protein, partial [Vicinamibacterales bacterium]
MRLRPSFQVKLFLTAFTAAALALAVAGVLFTRAMRRQTETRIERTLAAEAQLAGDLLGHTPDDLAGEALDAEADRIGVLIQARVTLLAADGRVLGDSAEPTAKIATLENHRSRPEVIEAGRSGTGRARRYSATVGTDMLYVAVRMAHPQVAFVRVALPLTDIDQQLRVVVTATAAALGVALLGAGLMAYVLSTRLSMRVRAIAAVAGRYRQGDLTPSRLDYGDDELGVVARALDESVRELGHRLGEQERDRSRTEAILSGMVEGVLVVDPAGRVQLANDAARKMLRLDDRALGSHYVEIIRHPAVADLVGAALAGRTPNFVELTPPRDERRTLVARAAPATAGASHGAVVVLHDISDLKRADQIRRDFVANVSHELRTPLTAIRGYVEALAEPDLDPEDGRRFLAIITRHALRMERLVKDLLRLARLDAQQEPLDLGPCELRSLIQTVVHDLLPSLEERRQQVDIDVVPDGATIQADAAKLHDILRNLIANASAYSPADTRIRVIASVGSAEVVFAVEDEGPGLPEQVLGRVVVR